MRVTCARCERVFEIDPERAAGVATARCVCGAYVPLQQDDKTLPRRLGKYLLERRLAVGGMGEIYYGKSPGIEGFERDIAVKTLLPNLSADASFIRMMVNEAKLTVRLNHPNIVQVYDLAKHGDQYFIVMEYIPGVSYSTLLSRSREQNKPLPLEVCVFVAVQVLRGLGYAHALTDSNGQPMHVLHRDVTPHNIMVTPDGWVKLADFGIAKALSERSTTSPGSLKGKVGYMAPEQILAQPVDHHADLFCMGIVLWESLSGRRLFKGATEIESLSMIVHPNIPSLSEMRSDVPEAMETVLRRVLEKDPSQRFDSANAFADALVAAMRPSNMDEVAVVARRFFTQEAELFVSEGVTEEPSASFDSTQTGTHGPDRTKVIVDIISLAPQPVTEVEPMASGFAPARVWVAIVAAVLVVLGAGIWWSMRPKSPADPVAMAPLSTPAPATAPAVPASAPVAVTPPPVTNPANIDSRANKALTASEIQNVIHAHSQGIAACLKGQSDGALPASLQAKITIETTGKVSDVEIAPPLGQREVQSCLIKRLRALGFRRHPSKGLRVTIPLKIHVM